MSTAEPVPDEYGVEFLEWLRRATERAWAATTTRTLDDYRRSGVGGSDWQRATRWSGGLTDAEIAAVEERYGLCFPPDYRLFLRVLHTTTPRRSGAAYVGDTLQPRERAGFFDWQHDDAEIRDALAWPLEGLLFDVESNALWLSDWGPRPDTEAERRARVVAVVSGAPRLIPIIGHRYLVPVPPYVVLSVYQTDIIVCGNDLRAFLLAELGSQVDLAQNPAWMSVNARDTPFWGQFVS